MKYGFILLIAIFMVIAACSPMNDSTKSTNDNGMSGLNDAPKTNSIGSNDNNLSDGMNETNITDVESTNMTAIIPESNETGGPIEDSCNDTDGVGPESLNYYEKGTMTGRTGPNVDTCNGDVLTEYWCDGDGIEHYESYKCKKSCIDGACTQ